MTSPYCPHCVPRCPHGYPVNPIPQYPQPYYPWPYPYYTYTITANGSANNTVSGTTTTFTYGQNSEAK